MKRIFSWASPWTYTGSGTVTWNLLGASFLGSNVGMEFQLNVLLGDSGTNSWVTVSDVSKTPYQSQLRCCFWGQGSLDFSLPEGKNKKYRKTKRLIDANFFF